MIRFIVAAIGALALVQTFGLARGAAAQTQPWNQEVMTATAGELEDTISGLRDVVRGSPNLDIPAKKAVVKQIVDNLRQMEASASSLHASLKRGAAMEETLPTYMRLQQLRRDTAVLAERVDITAVTAPKLEQAQALLHKMEPYYPAQPAVPPVKVN